MSAVPTAVVVFGREPLPGRVKTRLAAGIGAERAAAVYACLLEHAVRQAVATGAPVVLALAEPASRSWRPPLDVDVTVQAPGDLGERMAAAFVDRFSRGARTVVLIGSDIPLVRARHLEAAAQSCLRVPVVLGPSQDGGYWLVAQRAPGLDMFSRMPWSTPLVLDATRARLSALDAAWDELETVADVDIEEDLAAALTDPRLDPVLARRLRSVAGRCR